jgi:DNA-binding response OmpR family regulator
MRVLLIEDDRPLGEAVRDGLRQQGYVVDWVRKAPAACAALATSVFSAVVFDSSLPGGDGLGLVKWLRQEKQRIVVVITNARDSVAERISALDAGADDYLTKPFDIEELAARLRSATRRAGGLAHSTVIVGDVMLDLGRRRVTYQGKPASLTAREYSLVEFLVRRGGAPVTRAEIEEELYGFEDDIASNAIEVHIHNVRRKLGSHFITNLKGRGYSVEVTSQPSSALVAARRMTP